MKKLLSILILLVFSACSYKISDHFNQTNYIKNFNIHVVNDSLQLYFKSPADITYTSDKKELKKTNPEFDFQNKR